MVTLIYFIPTDMQVEEIFEKYVSTFDYSKYSSGYLLKLIKKLKSGKLSLRDDETPIITNPEQMEFVTTNLTSLLKKFELLKIDEDDESPELDLININSRKMKQKIAELKMMNL